MGSAAAGWSSGLNSRHRSVLWPSDYHCCFSRSRVESSRVESSRVTSSGKTIFQWGRTTPHSAAQPAQPAQPAVVSACRRKDGSCPFSRIRFSDNGCRAECVGSPVPLPRPARQAGRPSTTHSANYPSLRSGAPLGANHHRIRPDSCGRNNEITEVLCRTSRDARPFVSLPSAPN